MKYRNGDKVRAVLGPRNSMNPDRRNVGQVGEVLGVGGVVASMPYYHVRFPWGEDYIDECNLEVQHDY